MAILTAIDAIPPIMSVTHRRFMRTKMERGPKLESHGIGAVHQAVIHIDRVLMVRQEDTFFHEEALDRVAPDRQSQFKAKRMQIGNANDVERFSVAFLTSEERCRSVRQPEKLGEGRRHGKTC